MRCSVFLFLSLSAALWGQSRPDQILIFTNVNVVDMRDGSVNRNMTVVIQNGRILSVAHIGLIGSGKNLQVVNACGGYLIPGLWDMHAHTAGLAPVWDERVIYPQYLAYGVTGLREIGPDPQLLEQRQHDIESGRVPGPHLMTNEAESKVEVHSSEVHEAVEAVKKRSLDFMRTLSSLSRDALFVATSAPSSKMTFAGN
jgi:hypothetical protein